MNEIQFIPEKELVIKHIRLRNSAVQDYFTKNGEYNLDILFRHGSAIKKNAFLALVFIAITIGDKKVAVFDYEFGFQLEDLKKFEVDGTKTFNPILGATVNSIAYSTIRGLVFAYTLQVGRPIILPVIAAKDLISQYKTTFKG
jgi:hypothetical protein